MQVTPITVNNYRKRGQLLGLKRANRFMYPAWQFDVRSGQPIEGLQEVLEILLGVSDDPLEVLTLLIRRRDFFEGKSIKDLLLAGDVEQAAVGVRQSVGV